MAIFMKIFWKCRKQSQVQMQNQKSDWETLKTWFVSQISLKLAWKSGFLAFWAKIIKKIFLHHFPEAIALFRVFRFSIIYRFWKFRTNLTSAWRNKEDWTTLRGVRAILKKVRRESGVSATKNWNRLILKGFCSNLVQLAFLSLEIDIRTIFGVLADFRALRRISVFSDLAWFQWKLGCYLELLYRSQMSTNDSSNV